MSHVRRRYLLIKAFLLSVLFGGAGAYGAAVEEVDAWRAANRLGTPEAYQTFLEAYPTSDFAAEAFTALADSLSATQPAPAIPAIPAPASPAPAAETFGPEAQY